MNELVVLTQGDVLAEVQGQVGLITLNRAKALNALSLDMVRSITQVLSAWQHDPRVQAVAMRGMGKESAFGAFCAGCLLYTSPSPRDRQKSRMPSSA